MSSKKKVTPAVQSIDSVRHRFLTSPEVCALLRISRRQLGRIIVARKLTYTRVGAVLRFEVADVERFLAVRKIHAKAA
jgi:excisionase family DNA binding protein